MHGVCNCNEKQNVNVILQWALDRTRLVKIRVRVIFGVGVS